MIGEGRHDEAVVPLDGREGMFGGGEKLRAEMAGLRNDMARFIRNLPRQMAIAQKEALQLAGRRA
jgi:hypothetical protein